MSYFFAEGSKFYFSRTFAAAKTLSAITNADPAVATSVAHGYADLDEVLVTSGWEDANNAVLRVDQLTADFIAADGDIRSLLKALTTTEAFLYRRAGGGK